MLRIFSRFCSRHLRDEGGSVFIYVAVASMMLIAGTGAAIDMTRAQILQAKMNSALDAAGLAAGATAILTPVPASLTTQQWVQAQAQRYFNANFPTGYLGSGTVTVVATLSANENVVSLTASTTQPTTFMKAVGINTVNVAASSQVTRANEGMELALVLDNTGSMGNAVNPGNSNTSKIQAVKNAITGTGGLLSILYGSSDTVPNMWVGVVPFSQAVNIGTSHTTWMNTTADNALDTGPVSTGSSCPSYTGATVTRSTNPARCAYALSGTAVTNFGPSNWGGCVMSRAPLTTSPTNSAVTLDMSDDVPSTGVTGTILQAYDFPTTATNTSGSCSGGDNPWSCSHTSGSGSNKATTTTYMLPYSASGGNGPNAYCPQQVTQMTASKSTVSTAVNAMVAGGSTAIDLGVAWGWRMLSPNWQGKWGGEMNGTGNTQFPQLPIAYNTALMNKVVILMTDGMNEFDSGNYLAYGFLTSGALGTTTSIYSNQAYSGSAEQVLDNHTLAACNAMKAKGIVIYTIGFGTDDTDNKNSATSVNGALLKACATQMYSGDTSHYFLAPTNAVLASAFQQIGGQLANLRVSQ